MGRVLLGLSLALFLAPAAPARAQPMLASSCTNGAFIGEVICGHGNSVTGSILLRNVGDQPLTISSIFFTGPNAGDFSASTNCTTMVQFGPLCGINITFTPQGAGDPRYAFMNVVSNDPRSPFVLPVFGRSSGPCGPACAPCSLSPGSKDFGASAGSQMFTVTNVGSAALTINSISLTGASNFQITSQPASGTIVSPNQTATITVRFTPPVNATSTVNATLTINPGSACACSASLSGAGVSNSNTGGSGPMCGLAPATKDFGAIPGSQAFVLTNTGDAALTVASVSLPASASFQMTHDTGETTLAPNQSRTITISFTPPTSGSVSDTLTINSGQGGVCTASMMGSAAATGSPECSLSPASWDFGTTGASKVFTLTNAGGSTLAITGVSLPTSANFQITHDTGETSLAPNQSRTITISFTPPASGSVSDTLTINSGQGGVCTASVTGSAVPSANAECSLSPASWDFGTAAGSKTFTLTNIGGSTLTVGSVTLPASASFQITHDTGETTLASNQSRTITVSFTPPATGSVNDTLTITSGLGGVCSASVAGEALTCAPLSITCPPDLNVCTPEGQCGASGITVTPTVTPNAAGTTLTCVRSDGQPLTAPYPFGTTVVTCTARDACGNTATCTQRITVVPGGQAEVHMSVAGGSDEVTMNVGDCISLQMLRTVAGCSFVQDITALTVFSTDPARGTFNGNVFCATAAEANHQFPIYGTYFNACTGTYVTATVHVTVRRNDGQN